MGHTDKVVDAQGKQVVQSKQDEENRTIMAILGNLPVSGWRTLGKVTVIQVSEAAVIACLRQAYRAGRKERKEPS